LYKVAEERWRWLSLPKPPIDKARLEQILDKKYGKKGQHKRDKWEQEFEAFQLGVLASFF
jgi:hypothetical protein